MSEKCPVCGTHGKLWNKAEKVFHCPNCDTLYSEFGFVLESDKEVLNFWS